MTRLTLTPEESGQRLDQYLAGALTNYEVTDEEVANNLSELEKIIK